jgi:serine/threonine protein kinase
MNEREPVDAIASAFAQALRRGEQPRIEHFLARYPEHASTLAEVLPAVAWLEGAKSPPTTALPQRVGEYELLREIGRGAMGVVYEARQRSLDRRVALKLLPQLAQQPELLERFRREARTAAHLDHPHIVPVFDIDCVDGFHYIAMQLIEGSSLQGAGPLAWELVVRIGWEVATALAYAHQRGVLHRDIKPANLLRDTNGKIWVADFGLAKLEGSTAMTGSGMILGTLAYLAPECALGQPASIASDVYSLAATLYELLAGRRPFDSDQPTELLLQLTTSSPPSLGEVVGGVPAELVAIIDRGLVRNPMLRTPSATAFADELVQLLARTTRPAPHRQVQAPPQPRVLVAPTTSHSAVGSTHWRGIAVSATALAVLAGSLAGWRTHTLHDEELAGVRSTLAQTQNSLARAHEAEALATATLDRLFEAITSDKTADEPDNRSNRELHALRLVLLDAYERSAERPTNDELTRGSAWRRASELQRWLGRDDAATRAIERALVMLESIRASGRNDVLLLSELSCSRATAAKILVQQQRHAEAIRSYREALQLLDQLPPTPTTQWWRACWMLDYALTLKQHGESSPALAALERAHALWQDLQQPSAEPAQAQIQLANATQALAQALVGHAPLQARSVLERTMATLDANPLPSGHVLGTRRREAVVQLMEQLAHVCELLGDRESAESVRRRMPPPETRPAHRQPYHPTGQRQPGPGPGPRDEPPRGQPPRSEPR